MESENVAPTAGLIKKRVFGLYLMTCFTPIWAGIAFYGLKDSSYMWLLSIFPLIGIFFIYYAVKLTEASSYLPVESSDTNPEQEKKRRKSFIFICTGEGLGIFVAVNIAVNLHHPELKVPAMALVVGLHFFPLAKVFQRKTFYYLGAWSTLIAVLAIVFSLNKMFNESTMLAFTGIGLALATSYNGLNIIQKVRQLKILATRVNL
jgi:hypothetical protein